MSWRPTLASYWLYAYMLTHPEVCLQMSKSEFVLVPGAVETHTVVFASLNYLEFYKARIRMHIRSVYLPNKLT